MTTRRALIQLPPALFFSAKFSVHAGSQRSTDLRFDRVLLLRLAVEPPPTRPSPRSLQELMGGQNHVIPPQRILTAPRSGPRDAIIRVAVKLDGSPYKYGGATPSGFDCSGFVQYVYSTAIGIALPRGAASQYLATKRRYARGDVISGKLKDGDLIFFQSAPNAQSDEKKISHAAIWIGEGGMIHAPNSGKTTTYTSGVEYAKYWSARIAFGGSVIDD